MSVTEVKNELRLIALEDKVRKLEEYVEFLLEKHNDRKWTEEQLNAVFNLHHEHPDDLYSITEKLNEEFVAQGYTERTKTAVACQIWKMSPDRSKLSEEIRKLASKYMSKRK